MPDGKQWKLLVVDDDIDFAESLADVLEGRGHHVTLAHSGEECLAVAKTRDFDLALMDMKMPGMNGVECLAELRVLRPGIRVVMVTAFTRSELIRQALDLGAMAVLHKPVAIDELLETIAFLAGHGSLLVVEDEPDLALELSELLTRAGYQVETAGSLQQTKAVLSDHPVDLVLLDFRLPDGTAVDVLAWFKSRHIHVPVVILTGFPDDALASLPCLAPQDILVKPFPPEALLGLLRRQHSTQNGGV